MGEQMSTINETLSREHANKQSEEQLQILLSIFQKINELDEKISKLTEPKTKRKTEEV